MSDPLKSPPAASGTWSTRLSERYRCPLSPVLADWFDQGIWKSQGLGEYREPVSPEMLLESAPEIIWPGLMNCDLLPLLGNSAGDWLCAKVDEHNCFSSIVQWYHGGGDWIPWGNELSDAILFDALVERVARTITGHSRRRHAVPAEATRPANGTIQQDPFLAWALRHVPESVGAAVNADASSEQVISALLDQGTAEVAVRCEMVVALLSPWPRETLNRLFQEDPSLDREQLALWSFDHDQIPEAMRQRLSEEIGGIEDQNWGLAAQHASRVSQIAPHLSWGWDVQGYAAERAGDTNSAIAAYRRGAACSVFTDQSVRLDTHWSSREAAKFSVSRLHRLAALDGEDADYYQILCSPDVNQRRRETTVYWSERAARASDAGNSNEALRCWVNAAWDLGAEPITSYGRILEEIAAAADTAGQFGRAELARTHRVCLQERYGA